MFAVIHIKALRHRHLTSLSFPSNRRLEWLELDQVPVLAKSLVCHINTFLKDYTTQWTSAEPDFQPQVRPPPRVLFLKVT